jgi:hypothetical protein
MTAAGASRKLQSEKALHMVVAGPSALRPKKQYIGLKFVKNDGRK